jgi:hypothetical protein
VVAGELLLRVRKWPSWGRPDRRRAKKGFLARFSEMAGPWPVSGAAIAIGEAAHSDGRWISETISRLRRDAVELDKLASMVGWQLAGGTELFHLYYTDSTILIIRPSRSSGSLFTGSGPEHFLIRATGSDWVYRVCEWTRLRVALGQWDVVFSTPMLNACGASEAVRAL